MTIDGECASIDSASSGPLDGLDAWRSGIDTAADPVRLRRIEALARRAAKVQQAQVRRVLEQKLAALMAGYGERAELVDPADGSAGHDPAQTGTDSTAGRTASTAAAADKDPRGALSALARRLASGTASHALHQRVPSGETELLRHMQAIWSRLSADRRLTQSLAKVPDKAGPLNSHHLVHRALAAMREASPGYFHHFVAQVDALLALDQMMQAAANPAPAPAVAGTTPTRQRKARTSPAK